MGKEALTRTMVRSMRNRWNRSTRRVQLRDSQMFGTYQRGLRNSRSEIGFHFMLNVNVGVLYAGQPKESTVIIGQYQRPKKIEMVLRYRLTTYVLSSPDDPEELP